MQIPSATYRIQLHHGFGFRELTDITDYLQELGITAIYASPILAAVKGSEHGYDGIDPRRINPEIGTRDELKQVSQQLRKKGIGWIQDIVPNHLAFHTDNPWLYDVLERGISSSYARHFDIDWEHPVYTHKLMAPLLGKEVEDCIKDKEIIADFSLSGFSLKYGSYSFPVNPEDYAYLLDSLLSAAALHDLGNELEACHRCTAEEWSSLKKQVISSVLQLTTVEQINTKLSELSANAAKMTWLLSHQHYILCRFSLTDQQINYRRFFNINALISLRMEDEQVFRDYHQLIYELYQEGLFSGLRIDHIDGLKNPQEYVSRLRKLFGKDCYIIVEKILDIKEQLPPMDIEGTSGYEFLSYTNQLITDSRGAEKLLAIYRSHVPDERDYYRIVFDNKLDNLRNSLNGDWDNLLRMLLPLKYVSEKKVDRERLKMALGVFMAAYPVYRAYIESFPLNETDSAMIKEAFEKAQLYYPSLQPELSVIQQLFHATDDDNDEPNKRLAFIQRMMQFTGPMAAKGVEDTTFYQYNVLISHNEVGDAPCILGIPIKVFHDKMQQRILHNPLSLNTTSTHDTKRGEDARIRINLLSELTGEWSDLVARCRKISESLKKPVGNIPSPTNNDEYFLYQAIIGSLPDNLQPDEEFRKRTKDFFIKALRESKLNTNHTSPNTAYENACLDFIDHLLDPAGALLPVVLPLLQKILPFAKSYSLMQLIIKTTAPGIPDIYRGCELWDNSYVDPDNRRPVDYDLRKKLMNDLIDMERHKTPVTSDWLMNHEETGLQKLWMTRCLLTLRKQKPDLFIKGEYIPVHAGNNDQSLLAYLRHHDRKWLLVVLPLRIVTGIDHSVKINLPSGAPDKWENIFTKEIVHESGLNVGSVCNRWPVAVLQSGVVLQ